MVKFFGDFQFNDYLVRLENYYSQKFCVDSLNFRIYNFVIENFEFLDSFD